MLHTSVSANAMLQFLSSFFMNRNWKFKCLLWGRFPYFVEPLMFSFALHLLNTAEMQKVLLVILDIIFMHYSNMRIAVCIRKVFAQSHGRRKGEAGGLGPPGF